MKVSISRQNLLFTVGFLFCTTLAIGLVYLCISWPSLYEDWRGMTGEPAITTTSDSMSFQAFFGKLFNIASPDSPCAKIHPDTPDKMNILAALLTGIATFISLCNMILLFMSFWFTKENSDKLSQQIDALREGIIAAPQISELFNDLSQFAQARNEVVFSDHDKTTYRGSEVFSFLQKKYPQVTDEDKDFEVFVSENIQQIPKIAERAFVICNRLSILESSLKIINSKEEMEKYENIFARFLTEPERFILGKIRHLQYHLSLEHPPANVADRVFLYSKDGKDYYPREGSSVHTEISE